MKIRIIPFFSPITPKQRRIETISLLRVDEEQIVTKEEYISKYDPQKTNDKFFLFVGTGGTENAIAAFADQSKLKPPIVLLSYEFNNSLPAAMETRRYLEDLGQKAQIIHGTLDELAFSIKLWNKFADIIDKLHTYRIGIIGTPSEWLMASKVDKEAIKEI
ncbi:MAG: hypothetical protein ACFFDT_36595 [Candidatus Hodarchaeota archaeon]